MNVRVDKNKCIGCGLCAMMCPQVFEIKKGKSQIRKGVDLNKYKDCLKKAAQGCPVHAILIKD